ncbi:MAG: hypothetical protein ACJAYX_000921 [Planctomycetota bacterium]|jgi:hypothetical protein
MLTMLAFAALQLSLPASRPPTLQAVIANECAADQAMLPRALPVMVANPPHDHMARAALETSDTALANTTQKALQVQTETANGERAGIVIALTHTSQSMQTDLVGSLATDEQGRARLQRSWCQPRERGACVCVDAGYPTVGAYAVQLVADSEVVEVFLPARGRVHVTVVEHDGSPMRDAAVAEIRVVDATPPADRLHRYDVVAGRAEIEVECASLLLDVRVATLTGRAAQPQRIIGPATPDEVTELVVKLPPRAMFTARLLDAIGQPLCTAAVEVRLAGTSLQLAASSSDERGVIQVPEPAHYFGRTARLWFRATSRDGQQLHGELVADLAPTGYQNLGDVWLREANLLVSGVCVDQHGSPLAGAMLTLQSPIPEEEQQARLLGGALFGSRWRDVAVGVIKVREDGSFAIYGPQQSGQQLRLQSRHLPSNVLPFVSGASDVRFVSAVVTAERR